MPTAVAATVPPSRLCTKCVPPIVFAQEVRGTISICFFVISMRPVLCLPRHTPKSKKYRAERTPFLFSFGVNLQTPHNFWTNFSHFSVQNAPKIHPGRPSGALLDQSGGDGTKEHHFERFPDGLVAPFGGLLGHLFGTFFSSLRDTKKGSPGGSPKLDPFFVDFGVCLEGLRRVTIYTGAQFSLLQPDPKRAPKWEPKWSLLGSQIRTILTLGHHLGEIGAQKAASKNECIIWGGEALRLEWQMGCWSP